MSMDESRFTLRWADAQGVAIDLEAFLCSSFDAHLVVTHDIEGPYYTLEF